MDEELEIILNDLVKYQERLAAKEDKIMPKVYWKPASAHQVAAAR
jgi:hypothetical protein